MENKITAVKLPIDPNGHDFTMVNHLVIGHDGELPPTAVLYHGCRFCDGGYEVSVTDTGVTPVEPCPYPEGITTEITLRVPSGRIIVTDDLRPVYNGFDRDGFASYNTAKGVAQVIEAFAEQGCAFGYVGNSCPGLYRDGEGRYIIAIPGYDEVGRWLLPKENRVAQIISDLWAYSIADYDDWVSKGGDPEELSWSDTVVEIPAGTYKFTHHTGERTFDGWADDGVVYAHIEKIED